MTPNEYQVLALRTANSSTLDVERIITPQQLKVINAVFGAYGEMAEISEPFKKWLFQGHEFPSLENARKEIGDVFWYLALLATSLDLELEDIMITNIEKLRKRFPEKFDTNLSINREE